MRETWLRTNRRLLWMGMILPAALIGIGLVMALNSGIAASSPVRGIGFVVLSVGLLLLGLIAVQLRIPRLGYANGELLAYLRAGTPIRVPIEYVECLFLSSGCGQLPGSGAANVPLRNLVIRLSEKATNFHRREVKPALGSWEDGYITINGAWCEPLNVDVARHLNDRLAEVQRARQSAM